jgi:hypothetical protein
MRSSPDNLAQDHWIGDVLLDAWIASRSSTCSPARR